MGNKAEDFECVVEDGFVLTPSESPKGKITVREEDYSIVINTTVMYDPKISVQEAREIARRLYVLAARIEKKRG